MSIFVNEGGVKKFDCLSDSELSNFSRLNFKKYLDIVQLKRGHLYINSLPKANSLSPVRGRPEGVAEWGLGRKVGERPERSPGPTQVRRDIVRIVALLKDELISD